MTRAADRSNGFMTKEVTFRGTAYTIRELSIGEFDEITEQSTVKRMVRDLEGNETEVERLDGQLQSRLMMAACVTPKVKPAELPVRLYGGLQAAIQELHYSAEPDETTKVDSSTEEEGGDSPN